MLCCLGLLAFLLQLVYQKLQQFRIVIDDQQPVAGVPHYDPSMTST